MNIKILLTDNGGKKPLPNARLSLFLTFENGEERSLGPETSDEQGQIIFKKIKRSFLKGVIFEKSRYRVTYDGVTGSSTALPQPEKLENQDLRFVLAGKEWGSKNPDEEIDGKKTDWQMDFKLFDKTGGTPLAGAELQLRIILNSGEEITLEPRKSNKKALVRYADLEAKMVEQINFDKSRFQIFYNDQKSPEQGLGDPTRKAENLLIFNLNAKEIDAKPGETGPTPPPPPPPPGEIDGIREPQKGDWFVKGQVTDEQGNPHAGMIVKAFDRSIGKKTLLGKAVTKKLGTYSLPYDPNLFRAHDKKAPDLVVRLFEDDTKQKPLQVSGLIPSAGPNENVDFATGVAKPSDSRKVAIYTRLLEQVGEMVKEEQYTELDREDVALLSSKLGKDPVLLARFVRSQQLKLETELDRRTADLAAIGFFAWISGGLSANLADILACDDEKLSRLLHEARDRDLIPEFDAEQMKRVLEKLREKFGNGLGSPLGRLIHAIGVTDEKIIASVQAKILSDAEEPKKWKALEKVIPSKVELLKEAIEMVAACFGDYSLVAAMFEAKSAGDRNGLVLLSRSELIDLAEKSGETPSQIDGSNKAERYKNYAAMLVEKIELKLPHEHFLQRLRRDTQPPVRDRVSAFLANDSLRLDKPKTLKPLLGREDTSDLAELASLYQICPPLGRATAATTMVKQGYSSSRDVLLIDRDDFRRQLGSKLPEGEANRIYNRALHLESLSRVKELDNQLKPSANGISWAEKLFGHPEDSACQHCESVLGPASYLLDLTRYLDGAKLGPDLTGQKLFLQKLPHLNRLELNCANAETPLPYIDLVLERLERQVSPPEIADNLDAEMLQTGLTAVELAAESEHVHLPAYDRIKEATFPWQLPFNRQRRRTASYLGHLSAPVEQILMLSKSSNFDMLSGMAAIAMHGVDGLLLGNQAELTKNWGVRSRSALVKHKNIDQLAIWLRIEPALLAALLQSEFVTGGAVAPIMPDGQIDWNFLTAPKLSAVQFLGRLAVQTGIAVEMLDRFLLLPAIGQSVNDRWSLELAALLGLSQISGMNLEDCTGLFEGPQETQFDRIGNGFGVDPVSLYALANIQTALLPSQMLQILRLQERALKHELDVTNLLDLTQPEWPNTLLSAADAEIMLGEMGTMLKALDLPVIHQGTETETEEPQDDAEPAEPFRSPDDIIQLMAEAVEAYFSENLSAVPADLSFLLAANDYKHVLGIAATAGIDLAACGLTNSDPALPQDVLRLTKKLRVMVAGKLAAADLSAVAIVAATDDWPDLDKLPVKQGETAISPSKLIDLLDLAHFSNLHFATGESLFAILADEANSQQERITTALSAIDWPEADKEAVLLEGLDISEIISINILPRTDALVTMARNAQTDGAALARIAQDDDGDAARDLIFKKLGNNGALAALKQLNEPLREAQRDALLAYAIANRVDGDNIRQFTDADDLYEHYLFDPSVAACFETSRIVQACASAQQLVQRIHLGLEGLGGFTEEDENQWAWRKNYRVWEANRKVFLFPENWVEPELRDNKTELFSDLESQLLQGEVTSESAEQALTSYVRELHLIARMDPVATLEDEETSTQYVFARTSDVPNQYYLCERPANGLWSGWTKIDLEIVGDNILPVKHAGRLFLFWASTSEHVDQDHSEYRARLAELEADEDVNRENVNKYSRQVDDFADKAMEFEELAGSSSHVLASVWAQLGRLFRDLAETAQDNFDAAVNALEWVKQSKLNLNTDFTYHKIALLWSQYEGAGKWRAARRSAEEIDTVFVDAEGERRHERSLRNVWLRARQDGEILSVELRSQERHRPDGRHDLRIGKFEFDPLRESMRHTDNSTGEEQVRPNYFVNGMRNGQRLGFLSMLPMLELETQGRKTLLMAWNGQDITSVRAEEIAGYDPALSPFLFINEDRPFLVEPVDKISPQAATIRLERASAPRAQITAPAIADGTIAGARLTGSILRSPNIAPGGISIVAAAKPKTITAHPVTIGDWLPVDQVMNAATLTTRTQPTPNFGTSQKWRVINFYHPYADTVLGELYFRGLDGIYRPDANSGRLGASDLFRQRGAKDEFTQRLNPTISVATPHPVENFTFDRTLPYAVYNWELFFHAPFAIARHLSRNRKFEEAQQWLRYIFDPTRRSDNGGISPWLLGPFADEQIKIEEDQSSMDVSAMPDEDVAAFEGEVEIWENDPFNPHAVARLRTVSYMRATFFAYIENLIEWADDLFRRDSIEATSEATQLYVHAANLLGRQPVDLGHLAPEVAANTLEEHLRGLLGGQPLMITGTMATNPNIDVPKNEFFAMSAQGNEDMFKGFCMPGNDRLNDYWDTISDRLFKIRHCLNMDGVRRILPLFQPPIDPAMLVRAAAAGIDIGSAVAGLNAPRAHYRFVFMLEKARQFTAEVAGLGSALLAALEKKDAEELGVLRAGHEIVMQKRMLDIRKLRIEEAEASLESIERALDSAANTYNYYDGLIQVGKLQPEKDEQKHIESANKLNKNADIANVTASILAVVPQTGFEGPFPALSWGGHHLGLAAGAVGTYFQSQAGAKSRLANMAARNAADMRRVMEWSFQRDGADREMKRLDKDKLAAEIRLAITNHERDDTERQIEQSQETSTFLTGKFSNSALYGWMSGRLSQLHYQSYQLAVDLARQAEACMRFELDQDSTPSFIGATHWDSARKGLLAGEALASELRQMESHYLGHNERKSELTKHISLARLSPDKLLELRRSGNCNFELPEAIFDLDHPGHYRRRIKSISLTIPAVAGPQTTVGARLDLTGSFVRVKAKMGVEDDILVRQPIQPGISTSSAQDDAGLFQFDFRDERYLPFEGAGVISQWSLSLPDPDLAQFNYNNIADVIVHVKYTSVYDARFRSKVEPALASQIGDFRSAFGGPTIELKQLLSLRFDFPSEWARLANVENAAEGVMLDLGPEHFSYLFGPNGPKISKVELWKKPVSGTTDSVDPDVTQIFGNPETGSGRVSLGRIEIPIPTAAKPNEDGSTADYDVIVTFAMS